MIFPPNKEISQNVGTDFLNFKLFLQVPISPGVHLYCARAASQTLTVELPLSLLNVGVSGGGPNPAWPLSLPPDWGKVVLPG